MAKGRISGGSEDFGASGLPKKLSPFGSSPAESANIGGSPKNNRIFRKRRIYQLGTSVPTVETIEDARADKPEDT